MKPNLIIVDDFCHAREQLRAAYGKLEMQARLASFQLYSFQEAMLRVLEQGGRFVIVQSPRREHFKDTWLGRAFAMAALDESKRVKGLSQRDMNIRRSAKTGATWPKAKGTY